MSDADTCSNCLQGYTLIEVANECVKNIDNCDKMEDAEKCKTCIVHYYLNDDKEC